MFKSKTIYTLTSQEQGALHPLLQNVDLAIRDLENALNFLTRQHNLGKRMFDPKKMTLTVVNDPPVGPV